MGEFTVRVYRLLGVTSPFDPQHRFATSYLMKPLHLFLWRSLISIYTLVTLILSFVKLGASQFSFFTVLSYWGIWGWYTISAIHTFSFWWSLENWRKSRGDPKEKWRITTPSTLEANLVSARTSQETRKVLLSSEQEEFKDKPRSWLETWPRLLQVFHVLLSSTLATFPLIVTIVFWGALSTGAYDTIFSSWSNISVHALNFVFAALEILVFSRVPMLPWWHVLLVFILICSYLGVAYITHADQGFYTYDFLNIQVHGALVAAYVVAIGVGTVISFLIGQFLIFSREFLAAKIQSSGGWGSAKPMGVPDEAMIPTSRGPGPEGEGGKRKGREHVDSGFGQR